MEDCWDCWGEVLSGGRRTKCAKVPIKTGAAFRERFCADCRARGVFVHSSRLRVVMCANLPKNQHTNGVWNEGGERWPPYRIINQTVSASGPKLVILRDATTAPLEGLAEL